MRLRNPACPGASVYSWLSLWTIRNRRWRSPRSWISFGGRTPMQKLLYPSARALASPAAAPSRFSGTRVSLSAEGDHRSIDACPRHAQHRQRTKPSVSGAMVCKHSVTKALRVADDAILICRGTRGQEWPVERYFLANQDHNDASGREGKTPARQRRAPEGRRLRWAGSLCARRRHLRFRALVHRFGRLSFVSNLLFDHSDRRKVGGPIAALTMTRSAPLARTGHAADGFGPHPVAFGPSPFQVIARST